MFEIIFFGTCGGTEPMQACHHSSFAIKKSNEYYWFDAGEGCSRTALISGEDLTKIKAVFISHPHIDHFGGLMNLIWTMRKLATVRNTECNSTIPLFMSDSVMWDCMYRILDRSEPDFDNKFKVEFSKITRGDIYKDETVAVKAVHNHHLENYSFGEDRSFSFVVYIDGKKLVYTGDVRDTDDVITAVGDGCDYLIMETGHHNLSDVIDYFEQSNIKNLILTHHGRFILNNRSDAEKMVEACSKNAVIAYDGMKILIE